MMPRYNLACHLEVLPQCRMHSFRTILMAYLYLSISSTRYGGNALIRFFVRISKRTNVAKEYVNVTDFPLSTNFFRASMSLNSLLSTFLNACPYGPSLYSLIRLNAFALVASLIGRRTGSGLPFDDGTVRGSCLCAHDMSFCLVSCISGFFSLAVGGCTGAVRRWLVICSSFLDDLGAAWVVTRFSFCCEAFVRVNSNRDGLLLSVRFRTFYMCRSPERCRRDMWRAHIHGYRERR